MSQKTSKTPCHSDAGHLVVSEMKEAFIVQCGRFGLPLVMFENSKDDVSEPSFLVAAGRFASREPCFNHC